MNVPRWAIVTVTLVLFTLVMGAWGAVVNAWTPTFGDWLASQIGEAGVWALLACVVIAGGVAAYRSRGDKLNGM